MSPATVTENEGECKTSEPVQYPLFTGHRCLGEGGERSPVKLGGKGLGAFSHGCARTLLCDSWADVTRPRARG